MASLVVVFPEGPQDAEGPPAEPPGYGTASARDTHSARALDQRASRQPVARIRGFHCGGDGCQPEHRESDAFPDVASGFAGPPWFRAGGILCEALASFSI